MATKKQISRKHSGKKIVERQDKIIRQIQLNKNCSWLEAKHEYFENQKKYDSQDCELVDMILARPKPEPFKILKQKPPKAEYNMIEDQPVGIAQEIADTTEIPKKRVLLKLNETKLGVTMVLNLEDCKTLGFTGEELTKEVIASVREKLGLKAKKVRK